MNRNPLIVCISMIVIASLLLVASPSDMALAQSGVTVTLYDDDARYFENPPDTYAYANTQHVASPSEFSITTGGSIWRYYQWIALLDSSSWVEAQTNVAATSVGLQFWGDGNDGWGSVYVDGVEVWTGNTKGSDNQYPGGAFVKYLQISGLSNSTHTIRVESTFGEDVTIFFFGIGEISNSQSSSGAVPGTGLIAHYKFDGNANDASGNGNHATNNGGTFTSGVSGQAISLDGSNDYVSVPIDINPDVMPEMTIAMWVQANDDTGTVFSHDNGGYDRTIDIDNRGGGLGWSAFSGSGGVLGYHPVTIGQWVFIAAVYDQNAETVKLYVDDSLYQEAGSLSSGWDYFNIGSSPSFGANFPGLIDEVRVYDTALDQSEINAIRVATPVQTTGPPASGKGLVAHYPFDGDYQDQSGNNNHGTPKGSMTFESGAIGQGASFDGKSWIEVNDSNSLDLYDGFTFSTWLNKEDAGAGGWSVILTKGDTSAVNNSAPYTLAHTLDGRYPLVRLVKNNSYTNLSSGAMTDFGKWYHLAVTWDGTTVKYYIDGEYKDSDAWSGPLPSATSKLLIGSDPPGATEYFRGIIDDVRIYNRALSQSEINTLSGTGTAPTPGPTSAPSPVPPPATAPGTTGVPTLTFESRSKATGSSIQIPLKLSGVQEPIGNMDITLSYNTSVLQATEVIKGSLTGNSIFDSNILDGKILISLAHNQGFSGDGTVAYIRFNVIGAEGSSSRLGIDSLLANRASDLSSMNIETIDGIFTVLAIEEAIADCDGDGEISVVDALCALQMAVGKKAEDLSMDINNDGEVTSLDARQILRMAVDAAGTDYRDMSDVGINGENLGQGTAISAPVELEPGNFSTNTDSGTIIYEGNESEIAPGVLFKRSMALVSVGADNEQAGYQGYGILRFKNTSDSPKTIEFFEDIPKTFAQHVDHLNFKIISAESELSTFDVIADENDFMSITDFTNAGNAVVVDEDPGIVIALALKAIKLTAIAVTGYWVIFKSDKSYVLDLPPLMDSKKMGNMSEAETLKWMDDLLKKYCDTIRKSAERNNIPPRLLANVILNELADWDNRDQGQEYINTGPTRSHGYAQLQVNRLIDHGLIDIATNPNMKIRDPETDISYTMLQRRKLVMDDFPEHLVKESCMYQCLVNRKAAMELAAREIAYLLDMLKPGSLHLNNPWAQALLVDPAKGIDKNNIYANLKVDPDKKSANAIDQQIEREKTLALLIGAGYNGGGAIYKVTNKNQIFSTHDNPWLVDDRSALSKPRAHGINATYLSAMLYKKWCFAEKSIDCGEACSTGGAPCGDKGDIRCECVQGVCRVTEETCREWCDKIHDPEWISRVVDGCTCRCTKPGL